MLHDFQTHVNLRDDAGNEIEAHIGEDAIVLAPRNRAQGYGVAVNLEDAVTLAKAIMAFAETAGILDEDAALERRYEEESDARADALSAGWGHD